MKNMLATSGLPAVLLMLLSSTTPAPAETVLVDCAGGADYLTIQEGIDAASSGDTVLVAPCTYVGAQNRDLDFAGKAVVVMSTDGPETTIISCQNSGRGFHFHSGETAESRLVGFTIANGHHYSQGGGIMCYGSSPSIESCRIVDCYSDDGGGVTCDQGADASFLDCEFIGCSAAFGGGFFCERSSPSFSGCTFSTNHAVASGGGVFVHDGSTPLFDSCSFAGNHADDGGGMLIYSGLPVVRNCSFTGNSAAFGGALFCELPSPTLELCTFADNHASGRGGALFFHLNTAPSIVSCTLSGNGAGEGGGMFFWGSYPEIEQTIIAFGTSGAAIACGGGAQPALVCCDVYGNEGGDWEGCIAGQNGVSGNISLDPLFCGPANPDLAYSLDASSPCLASCGTMGAWGAGCGLSVVESVTWGRVKALYRMR